MDAAVASFLANVIKYFLYFILVMALLSGFGVATGSVIAVLGSAGLTVGMALQGSLSNFVRRRAYSFDEAVWRGRLHS